MSGGGSKLKSKISSKKSKKSKKKGFALGNQEKQEDQETAGHTVGVRVKVKPKPMFSISVTSDDIDESGYRNDADISINLSPTKKKRKKKANTKLKLKKASSEQIHSNHNNNNNTAEADDDEHEEKVFRPKPIKFRKDYKLGSYVELNDHRKGHVQYVGQTSFSKQVLYGIEVDAEFEGNHSGIYKGVKYFDTRLPNKGTFVPYGHIRGYAETVRKRKKHAKKLSAMIFHTSMSRSRVSFVVPNMQALLASPLSPGGGSGSFSDGSDSDSEFDEDYDTDSLMSGGRTRSGSRRQIKFKERKKQQSTTSVFSIDSEFAGLMGRSIGEDYSDEDEKDGHNENDDRSAARPRNKLITPKLINAVTLTPTGRTKTVKKKQQRTHKRHSIGIRVRIPFGKLNSTCMQRILSYFTMAELCTFAFVGKSCRDSIRLVSTYDFRYLLRDLLSVQETRKILTVLKFHKPMELILPMAYFIYDPVILRLFLLFFNVNIDTTMITASTTDQRQHSPEANVNASQLRTQLSRREFVYKYIHRLVIDDRDIRPNSWLLRPGNYPWSELASMDENRETCFPFELVECFHSLGKELWQLDIRYTTNIELSYFGRSQQSVSFLAVNAENRYEMGQFVNVRHLILQNSKLSWDEIDRLELREWKECFSKLNRFEIINQRFDTSIVDVLSALTFLPKLKHVRVQNCRFNEPATQESVGHMRAKSNLENHVVDLTLRRLVLTPVHFSIVSSFFPRMMHLHIMNCEIKPENYSFDCFQPMTHLTDVNFVNIKPKYNKTQKRTQKRQSRLERNNASKPSTNTNTDTIVGNGSRDSTSTRTLSVYHQWLTDVFDKVTQYVHVCPVVVECTLARNLFKKESHLECRYCKELVQRAWLYDHYYGMCREWFVSCALCGKKVQRKSMTYHWQNNCVEYYTKCMLCPKIFNAQTQYQIHDHILRHSMKLDEECGKNELLFLSHSANEAGTNEFPVYIITVCRKCQSRCICPVVAKRYRQSLIPIECDACDGSIEFGENHGSALMSARQTTNTNENGVDTQSNTAHRRSATRSGRILNMKKKANKTCMPHPYVKAKLKHVDLTEDAEH